MREAEHAHIDQPRVDRGQGFVIQPQPLHGLRPDVVGEHVGVLDQPQQRLPSLGRFQVQHDAALVAVQPEEERAHPVIAARADGAGAVAAGGFYLDHVGAKVAEHLRGRRAHEYGGDVHHLHTSQRTGTGLHPHSLFL
ncbi:hypothetical protein D3C81_1633930 [compost metagenome]